MPGHSSAAGGWVRFSRFGPGSPFSARLSRHQSNSQTGGGDADRPDLVSGRNPDNIILGGPDRYFDPSAFETQPEGFLGTAGRNFLTGPGLTNWDFSVRKDTPLAFLGESGRLEFRTEFFNILNHANFRVPIAGRTVDRVTAGQIDNTIKGIGRNIQFALKVVFLRLPGRQVFPTSNAPVPLPEARGLLFFFFPNAMWATKAEWIAPLRPALSETEGVAARIGYARILKLL